MRLSKRIFLSFICVLMGVGLAQAQFNPTNPSEPSMKYKVTLSSDPDNIAWFSGDGFYSDETTVWINASSYNSNYEFEYWTLNGEVYTKEQNFTYTLKSKDVKFVAHYKYNPYNPADPSLILKRVLNLKTQPEGAASFNMTSGERLTAGESYYIQAYGNSQYEFLGWYADTVKISDSDGFWYTMPSQAMTLTARYKFNPSTPPDPYNFYSTSCELKVVASDTLKGTVDVSGLTSGRAVYGNTITITATPKDGYEFYGWYDGNNKLTSDAQYSFTATSAYVTKTLKALFLHDPHTLTYTVDREVYTTEMLEAGSPITVLDQPEKDGYTFSGWSDIPATMPTTDFTVTGTFTLSSIRISPSSLVLAGGERTKLKVYVGSESTTEVKDVQWNIGDSTIAKIWPNGVVRGLKTGTTKVTAILTQPSTIKATCDVTVSSDYTMTELPDVDFEFNFNAHNYDATNKRIPNDYKANLRDCYLQLQGNEPAFDQNEKLSISSICKGYIDKWEMESNESGRYFSRTGTDSMTIICKVAPKLNTGISCDFIANRDAEYNYMLRIGDYNTMYLHTGTAYVNERTLPLQSEEEQVFAARVDGAGNTIRLDNLSTGESKTISEVNYGGENNTVMKFFYNDDAGYFTGDFYWCYMSFDYLTDSELNSVMDYNEDITFLAEKEYVNGDANASGTVNVTDITSVVGYIFGNTPSPFNYKAADANNSGTINVADVSGIVNIIYGTGTTSSASRIAARRIPASDTNHVSIDSLSAKPGDVVELQVGITSPLTEFSSYEMDLIMPEGIEVVESDLSLERTDKRNFRGAYVGEKYKLMSYSMDNEPFKGTSGTVAVARLKVDENMPSGVYEIKVRNTILSNQGEEITLPDYASAITICYSTGIDEITTQDNNVELYDLTGKRIDSAEGLNGMYIISTKDKNGQQKTHKILIH